MTEPSTPQRIILLSRVIEHPDYGTFGVLIDKDKGVPINTTLERVWKNNEPFVSCIPEGEYTCKRFSSATHPDTFEIAGVKNRQACLFHSGNIDTNSEGCVLVGEAFDPVWLTKENKWDYGITQSVTGFKQFMDGLKDVSSFTLIIKKVV